MRMLLFCLTFCCVLSNTVLAQNSDYKKEENEQKNARDSATVEEKKWFISTIAHYQFGKANAQTQLEDASSFALDFSVSYRFSKNWNVGIASGVVDLVHVNIPLELNLTFCTEDKYGVFLRPAWAYLVPMSYDGAENDWQNIEHKGGHYWSLSTGVKKKLFDDNSFIFGLGYRYFEMSTHTTFTWDSSVLKDEYMMHRFSLFVGLMF